MTDPLPRLSAALADRYRIERELGQGGMATVYLAEDLKHDRKVALKVLKPELAAVIGAERFVVEIKTTAALQHPHILPLFDSGEADSFLYYVMPFIDGETLRSKLDRETQLGIDEAVHITAAVADALDYAHRNGVIHRDIKPENILLHDGRPMVADFGIALALSAAAGGRMTETGMSLGTPHYMSPEQATAEKEISARSDVYSLGSVLYEMLTGNPPHVGASAQQIIMKIVTQDAAPVTEFRKAVPPNVAAATAKSLQKLPADRFESAKAFAEALESPAWRDSVLLSAAGTVGSDRPWGNLPGGPVTLALGVALLCMTAIAAWSFLHRPELPVVRMAMGLPTQQGLVYGGINLTPPRVAITPDGSTIIYAGTGPIAAVLPGGGQAFPAGQFALGVASQLWIRPLNELEGRPLTGTENGWAPAVSPDGKRLVFTVFAENRAEIRVAPLAGGPPITVANDVGFSSASWGPDNYIYFVDRSGLRILKVQASGGPVDSVATVTAFATGARLEWPEVLPDGQHAIVTVGLQAESRLASHEVHVLDLETGVSTKLADGVYGRYSPSGHLLYITADNVLMAVPFDAGDGTIAGRPTALIERVDYRNNGAGDVAISASGSMVYSTPGLNAPEILAWVTRDGAARPVDPAWTGDLEFEGLALAPDETRLAVELVSVTGSSAAGAAMRNSDGLSRGAIWIKQLPRGPLSRLTFDDVDSRAPAWSPDGRSIVYLVRGDNHQSTVVRQSADGSGTVETLPSPPRELTDVIWSADGKWLVGGMSGPPTDDIVALQLGVDTAWTVVIEGPADEFEPMLSPDGRWLAYASDESGQAEVYVRPFPNTSSGKWQISTDGGIDPIWSANGRELYYRSFDGNGIWSASLANGPNAAARELVLRIPEGAYEANPRNRLMAVSADGQRFLMINQTGEGDVSGDMVFVQNILAELRENVGQ